MNERNCSIHASILAIAVSLSFTASASGSNNSIDCLTLRQTQSKNRLKSDPPTQAIRISQRNSQKATGVRRIQQGMPYGAARRILIQQGWQPNLSTSNEDLQKREFGQVKSIYDSGYKEIKDCSGTGLGLCRFEFINYNSELLVVSVTSQVKLEVFHWFIDPPPQAIQASRRNLPKDTGVRGIKQRMPYRAARKILIQQGWQPNVPISNGDIPNLENPMVKTAYERGFNEIKNCDGTGLRLCRFEFVNYNSELLVVSATSQAELKVFHWFIERPMK
jgi:hypothetical protein